MEKNQEYEIYDIITTNKVDKDKLVVGRPYIIYYPNEKWKIRKVTFDRSGQIMSEDYINMEDKTTEVIRTLKEVLKRKNYENIKIEYSDCIYLGETQDALQINMPVYNVKYTDAKGQEVERVLEAKNLKDIQTIGDMGKEIHFSEELIKEVQIGRNNRIIRDEEVENGNNTKQQNYNQTDNRSETLNLYFDNVQIGGDCTVSKGNLVIHIKENGQDVKYDLRNNEGVEGFRSYIENQNMQERKEE